MGEALIALLPLFVALLLAGYVAGVIAGLLGVGGGIVMVPVLFQAWVLIGVETSLQMHLAVGTSLAAICVTSLRSVQAHAKTGHVDFAVLRRWGPYVVGGALAGAVAARFVSGAQLTLLFALLTLVLGTRMALVPNAQERVQEGGKEDAASGVPALTPPALAPLGQAGLAGLIGFFSALVGIGGGTFSVPLLTRIGLVVHRAVATSAGIGLFIAVPGTLGFIASGWASAGLPPWSLGYVSLPAFMTLIPTTVLGAPVGARLAHRLSRRTLRLIFAGFLLLTATRMTAALLF